MTGILFYGITSGWGKLSRIASIARHIPGALVLTADGGSSNAPLDYHGIDWYGVKCESGCKGVPPARIARAVEELAPEILVMDAWPYGGSNEVRHLVQRRDPRTNVFIYRANSRLDPSDLRHFGTIVAAEDGPFIGGVDCLPCVAFDADELLTQAAARSELDADERPLVVIPRSQFDIPDFRPLVKGLADEVGYQVVEYDQYPLMPLMNGIDLIVTHASWTAVEAVAADVPCAAVASPLRHADHRTRATVRRSIQYQNLLRSVRVRDDVGATYVNRSADAAAMIRELLDG